MTAAYMTNGIWNASRYSNNEFDSQARTYLSFPDLASQRKATKRMAGFLLRDTPVITAYFLAFTAAASSKVQNYRADPISQLRLAKTSLA